MVTTLGKDADKIHGLGFGADDYIEKALLAERPRRAREGEPRASAAAADGLGRGVPAAKGQ